MASGTLYTYSENFRAYKALIAAQYSKAQVKIAPNFVFGETNRSEEFLKKFPLGKVPAFESDDEKVHLTESNAIAYYVANQQLRGSNPLDEAEILQWMNFADSEILPASCTVVFPILGILQQNRKASDQAKDEIKAALTYLNNYLLHKTYLVGKHITLADICVACTLLHLYQYFMDPKFRKPFVNVNRWFNTIINQPQAKSVIGEFKLCDKPAVVDPKKYQAFQESQKGRKPEQLQPEVKGKDKKEKDKQDKEKEKDKQDKEKGESQEGGDPLDLMEKQPQTKDPFLEFPKGNFKLIDFKVVYSNEDEDKSIPYFWEKFDPNTYSIWFAEYKYPKELRKVFMSCNLITGMYQRLDKMRSNAFASMCLFGTDDDSTISGVWVWLGHKLAFELSPDWQVDYESYDWKKLDPADPATKELVNRYLSWTGTDSAGRKFNQGKIFK